MKKLLLFTGLVLSSVTMNAQLTCDTAIPITASGTMSVPALTGTFSNTCYNHTVTDAGDPMTSMWYVYTATGNGTLRLNANLPANEAPNSNDQKVSIFTGTCAALVCYTGSDDVSTTNYHTDVTFNITSGTTYYIQWDNYWNGAGFDVDVTIDIADCTVTLPYNNDWSSQSNFAGCWTIIDGNADDTTWGYNNGNDFTGDGVNDPVALVFPEDLTNGPKDEWLISPAIAMTAGTTYDVTVTYNGFNNPANANESLATVMLSQPLPTAPFSQVIGQATGIVQNGTLATLKASATTSTYTFTPATTGDYYLGLHENTPTEGGILTVFGTTVTAQAPAGVNDVLANQFSVYPNPSNNVVRVSSSINAGITAVSIVDLNGRTVKQNKLANSTVETSVNIADLATGVYMMNIVSDKGTVVKKIMKN